MSEDGPDIYSNSWYRSQFRGVMHSLNRVNSDYVDMLEKVEELELEVGTLKMAQEMDRSSIGQLRDSIERAREAFLEIKREVKNGNQADTTTD